MDTLATFSLADHACTVAVDSLWSNAGDGAQQPSVDSPKMLVQLHLSAASGGVSTNLCVPCAQPVSDGTATRPH